MLQEYRSKSPDRELRTILVEFDSYDIALAAHKSEAYQKALQALGSGAERDHHIVEGARKIPPNPDILVNQPDAASILRGYIRRRFLTTQEEALSTNEVR